MNSPDDKKRIASVCQLPSENHEFSFPGNVTDTLANREESLVEGALRIMRIQQGAVDRAEEHFELHYDPGDEKLVSQELVALLGPPHDGVVIIEYLVGDGHPDLTAIRDAVHQQITYYLVSKREEHPWGYAQYHCGTLANIYSNVHWSFIDPCQERTIEQS